MFGLWCSRLRVYIVTRHEPALFPQSLDRPLVGLVELLSSGVLDGAPGFAWI